MSKKSSVRAKVLDHAIRDAIDWQMSLIDALKDVPSDKEACERSQKLLEAYQREYKHRTGNVYPVPDPVGTTTVSITDLLKKAYPNARLV